ncbi:MAG: cytidine deaminase [Flavobacteriales bacterium]|jgi:cytidine deaminase|nr:cytidine deaminase [Flavobacteriales bacterium]
MPRTETIAVTILHHPSPEGLSAADRELVQLATEAATRAYAPYSGFHVGAAVRLDDGRVVSGSNQENASYPAGTCAERTALHAAMSATPGAVAEALAVAVPGAPGTGPVPPCGICRQVLAEQEQRQGAPLRILLAAPDGRVTELARAADLLPLAFGPGFLGG